MSIIPARLKALFSPVIPSFGIIESIKISVDLQTEANREFVDTALAQLQKVIPDETTASARAAGRKLIGVERVESEPESEIIGKPVGKVNIQIRSGSDANDVAKVADMLEKIFKPANKNIGVSNSKGFILGAIRGSAINSTNPSGFFVGFTERARKQIAHLEPDQRMILHTDLRLGPHTMDKDGKVTPHFVTDIEKSNAAVAAIHRQDRLRTVGAFMKAGRNGQSYG